MKSFEKFQYDTSPYVIDEEVEELDEDLVGMVKQGIKATGNVLTKGSEKLEKLGGKVRQGITSGTSAVSKSLQNRGVLPKPQPVAKRRNIASKEFRNEDGTVNREKYDAAGKNRQKQKPDPTSTRRYQPGQQRTGSINRDELAKQKSTPSQTPIKRGGNLAKNIADTSGITKAVPGVFDKKTYQGGIRSAAVRNVASIGNQIRKGLTAKPEQRISYDAKGTGFGGPTMGVGKNIQQAVQNVGDAKTFKASKQDPKTGRVTKGKVSGKLSDKMGLTDIVNIGKPESESSKNKKTKNLRKRNKGFSDMVTGSNNKKKSSTTKITGSGGDQLELPIQNKSAQTKNKSAQTAAQTSPGTVAATGKEAEDEKKFQGSPSGVYDKNTGKPMSRYDTDPKKEPVVIPNKNKSKKPKVTSKDADDKVYTHWADIPDEKQYSSKTPKLFEQFLLTRSFFLE